jgi:hypothetical protein
VGGVGGKKILPCRCRPNTNWYTYRLGYTLTDSTLSALFCSCTTSGLGDFDAATLQRALRPLDEELRNLDAEAFMRLERVPHGEEGARLCEG